MSVHSPIGRRWRSGDLFGSGCEGQAAEERHVGKTNADSDLGMKFHMDFGLQYSKVVDFKSVVYKGLGHQSQHYPSSKFLIELSLI